MWRACRRAASDEPVTMTKRRGTPVKRVKHSQSAKDCDCFNESPDKNMERNYILSFLSKTLPQSQSDGDMKGSANKRSASKKQKDNENNRKKSEGEKYRRSKSEKDKKNSIKRATSITLKRNRIIPLNDGSGGCVLVSQTTTFKETPGAQKDKEIPKQAENQKKKLTTFFKRITAVKKKARELILKRNKENCVKDTKVPAETPFTGFEKIPAQDDFIEESFQEDEPNEDLQDLPEPGRISACSSGYFTPVGESPVIARREDIQRLSCRSTCLSPESEEAFELAESDYVGSASTGTAVDSIGPTLDAVTAVDREELRRRLRAGELLYPNCDNSIWMRSCEQEIIDPIRGTTTGIIPVWLKGTLLRNGPGSMQVGDMTFKHLFDSSALLHRFAISDGGVTYQCRFLKSNTYLKNHAANRIVVNEFGTKAVPDPCQSIFKRVSALFNPGESLSDNAMISVYPFGDEFYCFTESPTIHRIDPTTLETLERVNVSRHVAVVNHTSHPHVTSDGTVYNQAMSVQGSYPHYSIVKFPQNERSKDKKPGQMFESAEMVASVKARWPLHPSYMHTFGLTEHFYVIVEQPLAISVPNMVKSQLLGQPMCSCFRFFKDEPTLIHLVERETGNLHKTYLAEAFFYLHIVNQYESDGHVVLDICCYSDPAMLDCMYYDALKEMNKNLDYARLFRGRPMRFVMPLDPKAADSDTNLVTLPRSGAEAWWRGSEVLVVPELLCDLGCETPRINYDQHLGKPYRYFYAISSDVDLENPGTLIKVDTQTRSTKTWSEPNVFPSEPIFVPSPDPQREDDGVILSALVWGRGLETQVGLLVLDATTLHELGRTVFQTPTPVPKCLHGWFTSDY
ncbi:carotenoid isomerooxygenase-like [Homalodisca vitripennis]|uniref:carotenoid isomerooxygenase-like n=1 Tax=Homalodisca vitripennis TaxID=197043 RepID=UPI001EE9DCBC|nr:carotenoid isomerooxygenase-like [Homalodisca vitripennis]